MRWMDSSLLATSNKDVETTTEWQETKTFLKVRSGKFPEMKWWFYFQEPLESHQSFLVPKFVESLALLLEILKNHHLNPWNLIKIFRISGVPTILSHILKSHQILCSLWNLTRVSLGNPDRIFITTRTSSFPLEKIEHNLWNLARISENRIMQTFWNTWNLGILRIFSQP